MTTELLQHIEEKRNRVTANLSQDSKAMNGQFMTPAIIAEFMANMFSLKKVREAHLLEPGAGTGSLLAAFLDRWTDHKSDQSSVQITAYEIDPYLISELNDTLKICEEKCLSSGVSFSYEVNEDDFILGGVELIRNDIFSSLDPQRRYSYAILNPPYRKIHSKSRHRLALRSVGIETSNLYTAFLSVAIMLLEPGGELVAITPRSFCNGPYFLPFRRLLLSQSVLRQIHVFHSRESAFSDDDVLQENIIFHVVKDACRSNVIISSSSKRDFEDLRIRKVPYSRVVNTNDKNLIVHIPNDDIDDFVLERISALSNHVDDLGLEVSTGPVVDYRLKRFIYDCPREDSAPLIYPAHFKGSKTIWPLEGNRKPNAIQIHPKTQKWLMPNRYYVLTKRFSSKEEKRRIVASLYEPGQSESDLIGFENHLNVYHSKERSLEKNIAKGLTVYLNSTIVDLYFRQFSGHTQVNASDLRMLPYPSKQMLHEMASFFDEPNNLIGNKVDVYLEFKLKESSSIETPNPVDIINRVEEAKHILSCLELPKAYQDDLSAHFFLSLANVRPDSKWIESRSTVMCSIEIIEYIRKYYGRRYVSSTCIRNGISLMRAFEQYGIVKIISSQSSEVINNGSESAQLVSGVMELIRTFGSNDWRKQVSLYFSSKN